MRKKTAILISLALFVLLSACGNSNQVNQVTANETQATQTTSGTSLTSLTPMSDSNSVAGSNGTNVVVGDWTAVSGKVYSDSIKFWVVDKDGYRNREYIKYDLGRQYKTLTGCVVVGDDSNTGASIQVRIYLDNELVFDSDTVSYDSSAVSFSIDVRNGKALLIECLTYTDIHAHGIVSANIS